MTRAEIIELQKRNGLPEAWREFAINLPTIVKQDHAVEIRARHFELRLRGTVEICCGFDGQFITIQYGDSLVMTVMNERMQVEATTPGEKE